MPSDVPLVIWPNGSNLSTIGLLVQLPICRKFRGREKAVRKTKTEGNSGQVMQIVQQINCRKKKGMKGNLQCFKILDNF